MVIELLKKRWFFSGEHVRRARASDRNRDDWGSLRVESAKRRIGLDIEAIDGARRHRGTVRFRKSG